ncbi:tetratricopeptide repeat protein [Nannocystis radixulma]|uniref:Tetratricopeptide repeat protein n=1 Tax=Nannocystis radixulma TaxID=2995305 RepID=A0ABT5B0J8_9BACT|nr:hypothetical protein [Nannocystis radixulma]MDC0667621.1 hypothetical protein [Nannocystis radixulma]
MSLRAALISTLLAAAAAPACKPREATQEPHTEDSARARLRALEARLKSHPDDDGAWREAAHLQWLFLKQADKARPILDRLAAKGDMIAQASRMIFADARLDAKTTRSMAQALIIGAATRPPADAEARRVQVGLAELAARLMAENHGELPDDDDEFVRFYKKLAKDRLPVEVTQPLVSLRAQIARRLDEPYLQYYDEQGCVRAFQVGPVEGSLESLELRAAAKDMSSGTDKFRADPTAVLTPLACAVRTWNLTPRGGVRRMRTTLTVPGDSLTLGLSSQEPMRVYLDGKPIYRSDRADRWPASDNLLQLKVAPGPHRLEVHTAAAREKTWVLVRASDAQGKPVPAKADGPAATAPFTGEPQRVGHHDLLADRGPLAGASYLPLRAYLAAADALAEGDSDAAERYTGNLQAYGPDFPEGQVLVAAFEIADPTRERTASTSRQREAIEEALRLAPDLDRARVRLLELDLEKNEVSEVEAALAALPAKALRHVPGEMVRFAAYLARGNEPLAEAALTRAAAIHPRACAVLKAQRTMAQRRSEVAREDALAIELERCAGTTGSRAALAFRRGRNADARSLLLKLLERTPDDIDVIEQLAELEISEGNYEAAIGWRKKVLALRPFGARTLVATADLQARAGDPAAARARVKEALAKAPQSTALHTIAAGLGIPDDLQQLRVEGPPLVAAYKAANFAVAAPPGAENAPRPTDYEGASEVLVLDRSAIRVYEDGSQRQVVHTIVELRSKDAIDRYGEITPPEGARVLTLHTIKADGTVFEPESIPEKSGLSLRGLQIGDCVEYELLLDREPLGLLPGYVDLTTFRFQSPDVPFHVSELLVAHPKSVAIKVDRRAGAPATGEGPMPGTDLVLKTWKVERSKRIGMEPQMRHILDEVPSVRVYTDVDPNKWLASLGLRIYTGQRANPELRTLAVNLTRNASTPQAKLQALWSWVVEEIEEAGDITAPATASLSARRGNRLTLLKALLREAGVKSELWLVRDNFTIKPLPGGSPMLEGYEVPVLAVNTGGKAPTIVLTSSKVLPIGYLLPGLSKAQAMRVQLGEDEAAPGPVQLPASPPALADRRSYDLELELARDGTGTLRGTIELQGMEAAAWRDVLRTLDADRINEGFERAELGAILVGSGAELVSLDIEHKLDLPKPLRLVFTAKIRGAIVQQSGELLMRANAVPMNMGLNYASLPQRKTGWAMPYAPILEASVTIKLDGASFTAPPSDETIEGPFGTYRRTIKQVAPGQLKLTTRSTLVVGTYEAARYPEIVGYTRKIKAAEDQVIRAK